MAQGKQAKVLSEKQQQLVLSYLASSRHPVRNKAIFLLSMKAGLRAKEIASLRWRNVCDVEGAVSDTIEIEDSGSKGKGGRTIPMNAQLREVLVSLHKQQQPSSTDKPVIVTERNKNGVSAQVIVNTFQRWYKECGLSGASSHSGRRTFITKAAKGIVGVGGSLRDIQQLVGHSSLQTTQRYIEGSTDAKRKIVDII